MRFPVPRPRLLALNHFVKQNDESRTLSYKEWCDDARYLSGRQSATTLPLFGVTGTEPSLADVTRRGSDLLQSSGFLRRGSTVRQFCQPTAKKTVRRDSAKRPAELKLPLGIAQAKAGKKAAALATLKTVKGTDGAADLARYWTLQINHPM